MLIHTQVEAHKLILAASGPFLHAILKKNKHPHPLVCYVLQLRVLACGVVLSDGAEASQHLLEDGVLGEVAPILFLAMASAMIRKCWRYSSTSSLGFLILPPGAMPTSKIIGISFPIILEASARNQAIRAEKKWLALHTQIHFHFSFFDVFLLLKNSHWG